MVSFLGFRYSEKVGISLVKGYEREGKLAISKKGLKGQQTLFMAVHEKVKKIYSMRPKSAIDLFTDTAAILN